MACVQPCKDTADDVDKCLALPKELKSNDGRTFRITSWTPRAAARELVTVTIDAVVELPDKDDP